MENVNFTDAMEPIADSRAARVIDAAANKIARLVSALGLAARDHVFACASDSIEKARDVLVDGRISFFKAIVAEMDAGGAEAQAVGGVDATESIVKEAVLECITAAQAIKTARAATDEVATAKGIAREVDDTEIASDATKSVVKEAVLECIRDISCYVESIKIAKTATDEEAADAARVAVAVKAVEAANTFGEAAFVGAACDEACERYVKACRKTKRGIGYETASNIFNQFCGAAVTLGKACCELRKSAKASGTDDIWPSATAPLQIDIEGNSYCGRSFMSRG